MSIKFYKCLWNEIFKLLFYLYFLRIIYVNKIGFQSFKSKNNRQIWEVDAAKKLIEATEDRYKNTITVKHLDRQQLEPELAKLNHLCVLLGLASRLTFDYTEPKMIENGCIGVSIDVTDKL